MFNNIEDIFLIAVRFFTTLVISVLIVKFICWLHGRQLDAFYGSLFVTCFFMAMQSKSKD